MAIGCVNTPRRCAANIPHRRSRNAAHTAIAANIMTSAYGRTVAAGSSPKSLNDESSIAGLIEQDNGRGTALLSRHSGSSLQATARLFEICGQNDNVRQTAQQKKQVVSAVGASDEPEAAFPAQRFREQLAAHVGIVGNQHRGTRAGLGEGGGHGIIVRQKGAGLAVTNRERYASHSQNGK